MHHTGPIWTVSFSHDGCYIATGGQDSIVRVWAVTGSPSAAEMDQKAKEAKDKSAAAHAQGGATPNAAAGTATGETGADEKTAPNTVCGGVRIRLDGLGLDVANRSICVMLCCVARNRRIPNWKYRRRWAVEQS